MTPTWQRIIKAGTGILEIAREKDINGSFDIDPISVGRNGGAEWVEYAILGQFVILWMSEDVCSRIEIMPESLDHLEKIAQAFEEALEIWRKM